MATYFLLENTCCVARWKCVEEYLQFLGQLIGVAVFNTPPTTMVIWIQEAKLCLIQLTGEAEVEPVTPDLLGLSTYSTSPELLSARLEVERSLVQASPEALLCT